MTIFPIREVAKYGVITDQDAYDLPTEAWSLACNVRFQNRKVARGPVWRGVQQPLSETSPRVVGNTFNSGQDNLFIGYDTGDVTKYLNGTETNYNPAGYTPATTDAVWTTCNLTINGVANPTAVATSNFPGAGFVPSTFLSEIGGLTTVSAPAQSVGRFGGGHKHQQKTDKTDPQKPKADDKAYNATLKSLPDKPYDPWRDAR